MDENIENCEDYGIYIMDRRMKSVEESLQQLSDQMFRFAQKTRRQRINQRNRTERLSDLLDWKRMGLEYMKARQLALRRAYPDSFDEDDEDDFDVLPVKIPKPLSAPGSPRIAGQHSYFDDDEEEEEDGIAPFVSRKTATKKIPAMRRPTDDTKNSQAAFEAQLLSEGDLQTLNKLTLDSINETKGHHKLNHP